MNTWTKRARFGLKHYHDIMQLGQIGWAGADSRFVVGCVDEAALGDALQRGYAVQAALRWGLEQLQQGNTVYQRQSYETLWLRYVEKKSVVECASVIGRDEDSVKKRQQKAWPRLGAILEEEWEKQRALEARRTMIVPLQYEACALDKERLRLLQFLAIFRDVVPMRVEFFVDEIIFQPHLSYLLEHSLVVKNEQTVELKVPSPIKAIVRRKMERRDTDRFHQLAADFYEQQGRNIETIYHWQRAGKQKRAIQRLLERHQQLDNEAILAVLDGFDRRQVPADSWAKLKLLEGDLAQRSENLEKARTAYNVALKTNNQLIRADAYYRLGRLYRQSNVDQSLDFFELCQLIVKERDGQDAVRLSIQTLLQETWVFIDQKQNELDQAKVRLDQIETVIKTYSGDDQLVLKADVANAWANYYALNQNREEGIKYQREAWKLALKLNDQKKIMDFGYNLAVAYLESERFAEAESLFLDCQAQAKEEKDELMVAACHKGVGGCYLHRDLGETFQRYERAYDYFDAADNLYWLNLTCYDLTEAHLLNGTLEKAQRYFDEGLQLATVANNEHASATFEALRHTYVELSAELPPIFKQIINLARITGKITKKMCAEQLDITDRTASRRLTELVERGLIQKQGGGRNVHYILDILGNRTVG